MGIPYQYFVVTNLQISLIDVTAKKYSFPIAVDNPLKPNNFRNCLGKAVVKWQICGLEIEDQHLKRSDKKSCWAKRINI